MTRLSVSETHCIVVRMEELHFKWSCTQLENIRLGLHNETVQL